MRINYNKEKFKKLCQKYKLSLVVLHGSYAKGAITKKSDIDIGFLGDVGIIKRRYFNILSDFLAVFGDKFDPVFLNGAESMITRNAALNGIPLFEKRKGLFNTFKAGALLRYMDTKKFRILEKQYIKRAIRNG